MSNAVQTPTLVEVNFDGLVGPTHNYAGLAHGNLAAATNAGRVSNPREAALQGLAKMRHLLRLGVPQAVLPPHERPYLPALRRMGFSGADASIVQIAFRAAPHLLANVSSASAMWTANAATVSPAPDTQDGRTHLTPANLASHFHRALETPATTRILQRIFADPARFVVHPAVPFASFGDEGAANHLRLCAEHGARGLEVFVHGGSAFHRASSGHFQARQTQEAAHVVASTHGLKGGGVSLLRQAQAAIDAGAFHNDVVAVANGPVLLAHGQAFEGMAASVDGLRAACDALGFGLVAHIADPAAMPLADAVASYVFNSQIVTLPDGAMALILPQEVDETPSARAFVDSVLAAGGPIREAHVLDLRQSMRNGGGPACLRLRVALSPEDVAALGGRVLMDEARLDALEGWVRRHYRDRLELADLADPLMLDETRVALDALSQLLDLPGVYDFQQA